MPRVLMYYVTCDRGTDEPRVVKASMDYDEVKDWRDRLALNAAGSDSLCPDAHPIRSHEVVLP